ncbi:AraC family transcriptional regulator [Paenibacillus doosanensis]|uniref:AraC family transcriptional regulator n=1 Tax=Paenibacillus TaxID=44249 RepID=UPI00201E285B|nr:MULTISPECIES: AraC family transcriptional regulator [Paenibacillus]MCS7464332.1 AraC family transcriptional regulator [Paenibacillus doosanensis]
MFGPKYYIENDSFSIQYMYRKGFSTMSTPHFHPFYEIYFLLQGERTYFINGNIYTARRGDMILVNPYDVHRTTSSEVQEFERILINFKETFVPPGGAQTLVRFLPFAQGSSLVRFSMKEQPVVEQMIREMLTECENQQDGYVEYIKSLMSQLLIKIFRQSTEAKQEPLQYAHPMHQKISEIATHLNHHFQENITLEQTAKQFYISTSYLSRVFKKVTGFHFREYLQLIRVKEAQRLLRESHEKVLTIAEKTGFEHVAHFNTTFKKVTGMTPLRYRKHNRNSVPHPVGQEQDYSM